MSGEHASWQRLCFLQDIADGTRVGKFIQGHQILVLRMGDEIFAFEDRCPHKNAPLSDGQFSKGCITCRHHHWKFDARTGASIQPRGSKLKIYPVKLDGGDIFIGI